MLIVTVVNLLYTMSCDMKHYELCELSGVCSAHCVWFFEVACHILTSVWKHYCCGLLYS